jgi:hypothetical protein
LKISIWLTAFFVVSCFLLVLGIDQVAAGGGLVGGTVYVKNYMGDYRAAGWANVTATNGISAPLRATMRSDGKYQVYLLEGTWTLTCSLPGYKTVTKAIAVSDGSTNLGIDFQLEESGAPIPEFSQYATPLVTALSLLLVIALLRKRISLQKGLN